MFLQLWNYSRGFVKVEVTGTGVERFINVCVHKKIYFWDVKSSGKGTVLNVSVKGFRLMKSVRRKTGVKIRILEKNGLPFVLFRYRKRKILLFGVLFFIVSLYIMTSFVWLIEVENITDGVVNIQNDDILQYCEEKGLKIGAFKHKIDIEAVENEMITDLDGISWLDISVKGTKVLIRLSEIIYGREYADKSIPCDIVAARDGLIEDMVTSSGTPVVRINDAVKKGDLLVSGTLTVNPDPENTVKEYVHAEAMIYSKFYNEISFFIPFEYEEKVYTGKEKKYFYVSIFNRKIDIFDIIKKNIPYANYETITTHTQVKFGADYPIPMLIYTEKNKEFVYEKKRRSLEQAKELAESMVVGRIVREFDFNVDVTDKYISYDIKDDGIDVMAIVVTIERIDEKKEIQLNY